MVLYKSTIPQYYVYSEPRKLSASLKRVRERKTNEKCGKNCKSTQCWISFQRNCLTQSSIHLGTANLMPTTSSHKDVKKQLLDIGVWGLVLIWVILVGFWGEKISSWEGVSSGFYFLIIISLIIYVFYWKTPLAFAQDTIPVFYCQNARKHSECEYFNQLWNFQ